MKNFLFNPNKASYFKNKLTPVVLEREKNLELAQLWAGLSTDLQAGRLI